MSTRRTVTPAADPLLAAILRSMLGNVTDEQFAIAFREAQAAARLLLSTPSTAEDCTRLVPITLHGAKPWLQAMDVHPDTHTVLKDVECFDADPNDSFPAQAVGTVVATATELGALVGACVAYEMLRRGAR